MPLVRKLKLKRPLDNRERPKKPPNARDWRLKKLSANNVKLSSVPKRNVSRLRNVLKESVRKLKKPRD